MSAADRKAGYKLPPATLRDKASAQELRRVKALEEQKRRRAQKIDASRQLDFFADLSLAEQDDEDENTVIADKEERVQNSLAVASVASYAALLQDSAPEDAYLEQPVASTSKPEADVDIVLDPSASSPENTKGRNRSGKSKNKSKSSHKRRADAARTRGSSKWADKCMYAELLEMSDDLSWGMGNASDGQDGLPTDLETAWVAVGPVPVGKRCLAVTHNQAAGAAGSVPNTSLRSRLLGKSLISPFPSALPPLTVLDCILDDKWRENGVLHVLDVVTWKGQDVSACEAGFRFWWRDTRLGELSTVPPASFRFVVSSNKSAGNSISQQAPYQFPYPTTFLPVPYYTRTSLADLDSEIIPASRSVREIDVIAPSAPPSNSSLPVPSLPSTRPFTFGDVSTNVTSVNGGSEMEVEPVTSGLAPTFNFGPSQDVRSKPPAQRVRVEPDGLLLYVAEAAYEPGTSPLSSWVPIKGYESDEGVVGDTVNGKQKEGPLDLFQRLVRQRLLKRENAGLGTDPVLGLGIRTGAYSSTGTQILNRASLANGQQLSDVDMMEY